MAPARAEAEKVIDLTASPDLAATYPSPNCPPPPSAGYGEDAEDAELSLAIALSLQQHKEGHLDVQAKARDEMARSVSKLSPAPLDSTGLHDLDRKAMEAERLARLKRKRDGSKDTATEPGRGPGAGVVRGARISPPPLRRAPAPAPVASATVNSTMTISGSSVNASASATIQPSTPSAALVKTYPNGIVLKTYAPGYPADRTISFPQLIAPISSLTSCLLSSFIWDFDWLFPHFDTKTTSFRLVMHAKYPSQKAQIEADFAGIPNVRVCFPPMGGNVNCMHSKLMLLFYPERCRVVVPTANLMGFDWGLGSVMENMLWTIDLPLLAAGEEGTEGETKFRQSLIGFLQAQTVPMNIIAKLQLYNFKNTQDVRFVHTIGGVHELDRWRDTGHCGLGKAVTSLGLATTNSIDVDFVTSSVGSLNGEFMRSIYMACQGDDGLTEYTLRTVKTFPARRSAGGGKDLVQKAAGRDWEKRFRFYFPSKGTVQSSNGGIGSAGTICFSQRWWEGAKFPCGNMRDCVSVRGGLLMHNKVSPFRNESSHMHAVTLH